MNARIQKGEFSLGPRVLLATVFLLLVAGAATLILYETSGAARGALDSLFALKDIVPGMDDVKEGAKKAVEGPKGENNCNKYTEDAACTDGGDSLNCCWLSGNNRCVDQSTAQQYTQSGNAAPSCG